MKNIFIIIVVLFFLVPVSNAQSDFSNEIKVGYGTISSNRIVGFFGDILVYPGTLGTLEYDDYQLLGTLFLEYNHSFNNWFELGGIFAYERISKNAYSNSVILGKETNNIYTIGVQAGFNYLDKEVVKLYSQLGLAYTFTANSFNEELENSNVKLDKDIFHSFNFHVSAIGVRVGKQFGVSAELGFGYKGIANIGIGYRF